jgi:dipeptidyl aminopeptidase/acylaminoacyl peptidase
MVVKLPVIIIFIVISFLSCQKNNIYNPPIPPSGPLRDTIIKNLSYGTDVSQKFDLGLPAGRTGNTPLVVVVHGGGWSTGDKAELNWLLQGLKQRGFAVANINYRLTLNSTDNYKMQLDDVDSAVKYTLRQAGVYTFNQQKLYIVGHSAGGHLSLCYAYSRNADNKVKAAGSMAGPTNLFSMAYYNPVVYNSLLQSFLGIPLYPISPASELRYKNCSPHYQATTTSVATIFFHGDLDPVVNPDQSSGMANKLGTLGVDKKMISYPLTFHDWWTDGIKVNNTLDELKNWFNGHL